MRKVRHVFFDLDHTLWDYDINARQTLEEIFEKFGLATYFSSLEAFVKAFHYANDALWIQYNKGEIDRTYIREHRFRKVLNGRADIDERKGIDMSDYFLQHCSRKSALISEAKEVLDYLAPKYDLHIITNGFEDSQAAKLANGGIRDYFDLIITSETAGYRKPSPDIFHLALSRCDADQEEVVMIGDNPKTDIAGAVSAGWKAIWYNPSGDTGYDHDPQISNLSELRKLL